MPFALLGILQRVPSHGYDLKREYDSLFGRDKPVPFGQVYATLSRLARDGHDEARPLVLEALCALRAPRQGGFVQLLLGGGPFILMVVGHRTMTNQFAGPRQTSFRALDVSFYLTQV